MTDWTDKAPKRQIVQVLREKEACLTATEARVGELRALLERVINTPFGHSPTCATNMRGSPMGCSCPPGHRWIENGKAAREALGNQTHMPRCDKQPGDALSCAGHTTPRKSKGDS